MTAAAVDSGAVLGNIEVRALCLFGTRCHYSHPLLVQGHSFAVDHDRRLWNVPYRVFCLQNTVADVPPVKKACLNAEKSAAPQLRVKLLSGKATPPKRGSPGAAGYDLARYVRSNTKGYSSRFMPTLKFVCVYYRLCGACAPRVSNRQHIQTG